MSSQSYDQNPSGLLSNSQGHIRAVQEPCLPIGLHLHSEEYCTACGGVMWGGACFLRMHSTLLRISDTLAKANSGKFSGAWCCLVELKATTATS